MKKIIRIAFTMLILLSFIGCANSNGNQNSKKTEWGQVEYININNSKSSFSYNSHRIGQDEDGNDILIINFTYTNHDSEPNCAALAADLEVYQEGVEIKRSYNYDYTLDLDLYNNYGTKIMKDKTIECEVDYELKGYGEICLRAYPIIDGRVSNNYQEQILSIED